MRKIFTRSSIQLTEREESQGRSNKNYSHTPFFRMLRSLRMLVLRTHTSTPSLQVQSMRDSSRRSHCLWHPFTCSLIVVQKNSRNKVLNINNFGNGLSITQSSAFRSLKKTNTLRGSTAIKPYQKTSILLRDFPELDCVLNCFIQRPQREKKKNKQKQTHKHTPQKNKIKTPSKQHGV